MKPAIDPEDLAYCLDLVRENSQDLYLADLLLDDAFRDPIVILHAFHVEISNICLAINEPMASEIRLQWWSDILSGNRAEEAQGHPLARAIVAVIAAHKLPAAPFLAKLEAHIFDLYNDPMGERTMFEGYCGETRSCLFQLAALIAESEQSKSLADACGHGGVAFGVAAVLQNQAFYRASGRLFIPSDLIASVGLDTASFLATETEAHHNCIQGFAEFGQEHLNKAQTALTEIPNSSRQLFRHLGLIAVVLDRAKKNPKSVLSGMPAISQLRKQWILWRS